MNINEMTVEQIELYLQDRKARKSELGGKLMLADDVPVGQTVWIKFIKQQTGNTGSLFSYDIEDESEDIRIYNKALVETNVPERVPARRRMTAAEASEQLEEGRDVWVKCSVSLSDPKDKRQPLRVAFDYLGSSRLLLAETQIEVDA